MLSGRIALAGIFNCPGPKSNVGCLKRRLRLGGRCRLRLVEGGVVLLLWSKLIACLCGRFLEFLVSWRSLGESEWGLHHLSSVCGRFCLPCALHMSPRSWGDGDGDCLTRRNSVVDRFVLLLLLKFFRFLHILLVVSRPLGTAATMSSAVICVWPVCSDDVVCGAVFPLVVSALCHGSVKSASAAVTPPPPETVPGPQRHSHLQSQRHGLHCHPLPYWRGD
jgi:hypothetical protein